MPNTNKKKGTKSSKSVLYNLLKIKKSDAKNSSWVVLLFKVIIALTICIIKLIWSLIKFVFYSVNNAIDISSIIITLLLISKWIMIATEDIFEIDEKGKTNYSTKYANILAKNLDDYKIYWSLFIFLLFLKVMKYFNFSYKLSIFYETIKAASFDLVFATLSFVVIWFGFSFVGNLIFGLSDPKFRYFSYSLMTLFELTCGGKKYW